MMLKRQDFLDFLSGDLLVYRTVYTWNPNDPCLGYKRHIKDLVFEGRIPQTKDKWVPGIILSI